MSLARYETTLAISDRQLRDLVKWAFYASRLLMIDVDLDRMAQDDEKIAVMLTEIEAANTDLQAGASAYRDGPDAFHERFPEGFKSI